MTTYRVQRGRLVLPETSKGAGDRVVFEAGEQIEAADLVLAFGEDEGQKAWSKYIASGFIKTDPKPSPAPESEDRALGEEE